IAHWSQARSDPALDQLAVPGRIGPSHPLRGADSATFADTHDGGRVSRDRPIASDAERDAGKSLTRHPRAGETPHQRERHRLDRALAPRSRPFVTADGGGSVQRGTIRVWV